MSNASSSSNKNHSKKVNSARERDKNKSVTSESGGSSQCDTPPLTDKDGGILQGKFAGIGAESVNCMAEQLGAEINTEAATNLAEDVSYKLRQMISTIALHSGLLKKARVDSADVNSVLTLSDTSPVVGANAAPFASFNDDKYCCQTETLLNVADSALIPQTYVFTTLPTISTEWITDEKSLSTGVNNISSSLHNYYTKVARAILNLKRKPKEVAVSDLKTNPRIGPIFPNLFNLAVLVLNDDNLNALNVPMKKPLQANILDMVDALCSNPCSLDTNIQQQFQRLFPVMVSNILGNGTLAEKMVAVLTKITRTWPPFVTIGKGILIDYLAQGTKERLTAQMIKCIMALGRQALVECLGKHLNFLDDCCQLQRRKLETGVREAILVASTLLLRSEPTTSLEDFVTTDYTLYEMLGDSIMPCRTLFPHKVATNGDKTNEKSCDDDYSHIPLRPVMRRPRIHIVPVNIKPYIKIPREAVFDPTKFRIDKCIKIRIKNCRTKDIQVRKTPALSENSQPHVIAASGHLNRFKYKLSKTNEFPIFGTYLL